MASMMWGWRTWMLAAEVGDGAGDFEDAVVGSRAHVHAGDGLAQLGHALGVGLGVLVQQRGGHLGVAVHAGVVLEAQAQLTSILTKETVEVAGLRPVIVLCTMS